MTKHLDLDVNQFWVDDALAQRFSDTIKRVIIEMGDIMDAEAGVKPEERGKCGFSFADDNCCLLNPEMGLDCPPSSNGKSPVAPLAGRKTLDFPCFLGGGGCEVCQSEREP